MITFLKPKFLLKLVWFGFGLFGLIILAKEYFPDFWPNLKNSSLVKGVQSGLVQSQTADFSSQSKDAPVELKNLIQLDPEKASQIISQVINQEITKILETTTTEIKQFPQKQVQKIKIGVCENLLEEDICSAARELKCQ